MQRARHQFLAHPGFTSQQHGELAVAGNGDIVHQALVRRALANQSGRRAFCSQGPVAVGQLPLVLYTQRQPVNPLRHADGRRRQAGKGLQIAQVHGQKPLFGQRVKGQQTPSLVADLNRAAHTVVHFEQPLHAFDQAVIGVGQGAVCRKAGGPVGLQDLPEARMFVDPEAPAEGVRTQSIDGQRHQPGAFQPQQCRSITRQQSSKGFKQTAITLAVGQLARQVIDQRHQCLQQGFGVHIDSL